MLRILHFADLHLDGPLAAASRQVSGFDPRRDALRGIVDLALSLKVDALTVGGDLYEHEHVSSQTGRFVADQFARLGSTRVLIAPGNHDPHVDGSLYQDMPWPSNVEIFRDTRWRAVRLTSDAAIWGIGHDRVGLQENLLSTLRPNAGCTSVALFHGWDLGAGPRRDVLHCPFTGEDVERSGVDFALVGHYHRMSLAPRHEPRYGYPGAPLGLDPDDGAGHVLLLSLEHDRVSVEPLELTPVTCPPKTSTVRPHSALDYRPPAPETIVPEPGSAPLRVPAMAGLT